jgi:hypothetical protein
MKKIENSFHIETLCVLIFYPKQKLAFINILLF